ncbi:GntR family transcriptional regulator [Sphingomonas sp.]|uniref:GntR family transcriptional regulator n=1 Tax=Sphingomonas sp. TaxID=28214 RepID=UPI003D6D8675
MNSGATAERVYDALKERLLSGDLRPGERLEPARLGEAFASSVTPVRDALHRLAGERLVETRTSDGFHLPLVTESGLRALYAWNDDLVRLAVRTWPHGQEMGRGDALSADAARATRQLFALIGARSANAEHGVQLQACSDRLAAARSAERRVLDAIDPEIRTIATAFDHGAPGELIKLVRAYHRRRIAATPRIAHALYQPDANNRFIADL